MPRPQSQIRAQKSKSEKRKIRKWNKYLKLEKTRLKSENIKSATEKWKLNIKKKYLRMNINISSKRIQEISHLTQKYFPFTYFILFYF